jgi:hypothetical protein
MHPTTARRIGFGIAVTLAATLTIRPVFADDAKSTLLPRSPVLYDTSRYPPIRSEAQLAFELRQLSEVRLHEFGPKLRVFANAMTVTSEHPALEIIDIRPDLNGLPALRGDRCTLSPEEGRDLEQRSRQLRNTFLEYDTEHFAVPHRRVTVMKKKFREDVPLGRQGSLVLQMLQCADEPFRAALIDLARNAWNISDATPILVHRSLFELNPKLRREAQATLATQPAHLGREKLLAAFEHPWGPVADHASESLIAMNDKGAVSALIRLLDAPNPAAPVKSSNENWEVREVVKINHARNCQLCHAPSFNRSDPARVRVPARDKALPSSFSSEYYITDQAEPVVRADVT